MAHLFTTQRNAGGDNNYGGYKSAISVRADFGTVDGVALKLKKSIDENEAWAAKIMVSLGECLPGATGTMGNKTVECLAIDREKGTATFDVIKGFNADKRANSQFVISWGGNMSFAPCPDGDAGLAAENAENAPENENMEGENNITNIESYIDFPGVREASEKLEAAKSEFQVSLEKQQSAQSEFDKAYEDFKDAEKSANEAWENYTEKKEAQKNAQSEFDKDPDNFEKELENMEAQADASKALAAAKRAEKAKSEADLNQYNKAKELDGANNELSQASENMEAAQKELAEAIEKAKQSEAENSEDENTDDENSENSQSEDGDENTGENSENEDGENTPESEDENTGDDVEHKALKHIVACLKAGINVMQIGPSGTGKTTNLIKAAKKIGAKYFSQGTTFDVSEIKGYKDANGRYVPSNLYLAFDEARKSPSAPVLVGLEEIESWDPQSSLAMCEMVANKRYTFPNGETIYAPNIVFGACGNTIGRGASVTHRGRQEMDGAMINRFFALVVDYDPAIDLANCRGDVDLCELGQKLRQACRERKLPYEFTPPATSIAFHLLLPPVCLVKLHCWARSGRGRNNT